MNGRLIVAAGGAIFIAIILAVDLSTRVTFRTLLAIYWSVFVAAAVYGASQSDLFGDVLWSLNHRSQPAEQRAFISDTEPHLKSDYCSITTDGSRWNGVVDTAMPSFNGKSVYLRLQFGAHAVASNFAAYNNAQDDTLQQHPDALAEAQKLQAGDTVSFSGALMANANFCRKGADSANGAAEFVVKLQDVKYINTNTWLGDNAVLFAAWAIAVGPAWLALLVIDRIRSRRSSAVS
ncbi:hypothetical protein [Acidisphaera sp. L21]|uniref:hypothetical protein n=1 Tax=Acidisphaera sp. L21 TaxID=1641851 RepID=UPI00131A8074|nr:hypothetical protein [Acidisphaera sp. L21]